MQALSSTVRAPVAVAPKAGARRAQRAAAKPAMRLNKVAKEATFSGSVSQRLQSVKVRATACGCPVMGGLQPRIALACHRQGYSIGT